METGKAGRLTGPGSGAGVREQEQSAHDGAGVQQSVVVVPHGSGFAGAVAIRMTMNRTISDRMPHTRQAARGRQVAPR